jgi:hypothetical protein
MARPSRWSMPPENSAVRQILRAAAWDEALRMTALVPGSSAAATTEEGQDSERQESSGQVDPGPGRAGLEARRPGLFPGHVLVGQRKHVRLRVLGVPEPEDRQALGLRSTRTGRLRSNLLDAAFSERWCNRRSGWRVFRTGGRPC